MLERRNIIASYVFAWLFLFGGVVAPVLHSFVSIRPVGDHWANLHHSDSTSPTHLGESCQDTLHAHDCALEHIILTASPVNIQESSIQEPGPDSENRRVENVDAILNPLSERGRAPPFLL